MFEFLCSDDWWKLQLKYTNSMLLGSDKINQYQALGGQAKAVMGVHTCPLPVSWRSNQ